MTDGPSERHNRLAQEFVAEAVSSIMHGGGGVEEVMILLESVVVSAMLINVKVFDMKPAVAAEMVEVALQRATERFTILVNK